jgi:hypothetical protein
MGSASFKYGIPGHGVAGQIFGVQRAKFRHGATGFSPVASRLG